MEHSNKYSRKLLLKLINRCKDFLKNDPVVIDICKKYKSDPDILDIVPIIFGNIDVSATTEKGVIILNYKLLTSNNLPFICSYIVHELNHFFQQTTGENAIEQSPSDDDYLKDPNEQEGFQRQIEFIDDQFGKQQAEKYTNDLLNYHDVKGKDKKELKSELMEKIDD